MGSAENIVSEIKRKQQQQQQLGCGLLKASECKWILGSSSGSPWLLRWHWLWLPSPLRVHGESLPLCKEVPLLPLWGFPSPWSECWHHVTFLFPHPWSLSPVHTVSCANSRPWILCCGCCGCYGFGLHGGGGRDGRALFYGTGQLCIIKVMVFPVIMYRCESWIIKY